MKKCAKCSEEKDKSEFYKSSKSEDGRQPRCKECEKKYKKDNKERLDIYNINYRAMNKDKINEYYKLYYSENKEKVNLKNRKYNRDNRSKLNEQRRERLKTDVLFNLTYVVRSLIANSLRKNGFGKSPRTEKVLGCTFEEFKSHIESLFKPWMTWENRALYNGELNYGWELDHIIPLTSASTEEEIIKLSHYTNLQPLCSYTNRHIKRDRLDWTDSED